MTVNASWRQRSAGTATGLVEKWRSPSHLKGAGELATSVRLDPPRASCRAFPAEIAGMTVPVPASPQSLLQHGNGGAGRNLHARRCVASATNLHDALAVQRARNSTMRCRKKLYDALLDRRYAYPSGLKKSLPELLRDGWRSARLSAATSRRRAAARHRVAWLETSSRSTKLGRAVQFSLAPGESCYVRVQESIEDEPARRAILGAETAVGRAAQSAAILAAHRCDGGPYAAQHAHGHQ